MTNSKYTEAELAAIAREVEHEDEIEAQRDEWESDYTIDPSGQSGEGW
jgi:hypothetical protein